MELWQVPAASQQADDVCPVMHHRKQLVKVAAAWQFLEYQATFNRARMDTYCQAVQTTLRRKTRLRSLQPPCA